MSGIRLSWWMRMGLGGCAVALLAVSWAVRRPPTVTVSSDKSMATSADSPNHAGQLRLVSQGWHIRSMATAHGAFVIEVESEDSTQTEAIARALIEPIRDDDVEVLVYVNTPGSDLPARRMQWTPGGGYLAINYDPDR
jgi:hypothetical protein